MILVLIVCFEIFEMCFVVFSCFAQQVCKFFYVCKFRFIYIDFGDGESIVLGGHRDKPRGFAFDGAMGLYLRDKFVNGNDKFPYETFWEVR